MFKVTHRSIKCMNLLCLWCRTHLNNKTLFFGICRLNCRPLGVIFCTILLAFSYKQLYPRSRIQIPYEVQHNLNTLVDNFTQLRKDKPGAFCVIISSGLVTLAIAGHLISGAWLVMGTLIGILFLCAKYKVKVVHESNEDTKEDVNIQDAGKFLV